MPRSKRIRRDLIKVKEWNVEVGELRPIRRTARKGDHLFKWVAEKLPWDALPRVPRYVFPRCEV